MKKNIILLNKKIINNYKDGYNLNSKYWKEWKKSLPLLPLELIEISIGIILGDASISKIVKLQSNLNKVINKQNFYYIYLNYLKVIVLWVNLVNEYL